jgi:transposase-like protein
MKEVDLALKNQRKFSPEFKRQAINEVFSKKEDCQ